MCIFTDMCIETTKAITLQAKMQSRQFSVWKFGMPSSFNLHYIYL